MLQFLGAFLIVISIGVAKTPDILQLIYPKIDDNIVSKVLSSNGSETVEKIATTGVNSIPTAAILLALVASCNSGNLNFCCYKQFLYFKTCFFKLELQFILNNFLKVVTKMNHFWINSFGYMHMEQLLQVWYILLQNQLMLPHRLYMISKVNIFLSAFLHFI